MVRRIFRELVPHAESTDPDLRREIARLSVRGLRVVALVGLGATLLTYLSCVSRGIVTEHGGHLEIESREAEGTIARIRLPIRLEGS